MQLLCKLRASGGLWIKLHDANGHPLQILGMLNGILKVSQNPQDFEEMKFNCV